MEKNAHLKLTNTYLYKRMLNIPRIVLLFLCVSFTVPSLAETTTMQLPQLSLSLNNVTIREVFNIIEKNTEYVFIFSDELLTDLNGKVSIHVNKQTLDKILDKVLQSTGLTYKITNRQVTVSKKSQAVVQKTSLKVTGHVSDEKGEPLIGVNIQEEGTNNVVVTDMNGNFSMYNISGPSSVLKFTYIGFIPLRVVVGKQTNLSVKLESDVKGLEEVVVVGYGSQKRESVIGAITTMKPAALQINQSRSVTNALAGQVAGIIAVQRSGEPGNDASDFWIRGISSFGSGTTPLVLVDVLVHDGIVIYPTDSVYAFGCSLHSPKAIERLRRMKGKDAEAFSVVFGDMAQVAEYCRVDNTAFRILKRNLPGPFTFVLTASSRVPDKALEKRRTIGIRIPDNAISRAIVAALGCPLVTTSVKDDDQVVEYTTDPELIHERYGRDVALVIDGGMGDNVPTTVVDLTGDEPEVLREGKGELQ